MHNSYHNHKGSLTHEVRLGFSDQRIASRSESPLFTGVPDRYFSEVARQNGWKDIWPKQQRPHIDERARTVFHFLSWPGEHEGELAALDVAVLNMAGWLIEHELPDSASALFVAESRIKIPEFTAGRVGADFMPHTDRASELLEATILDFRALGSLGIKPDNLR